MALSNAEKQRRYRENRYRRGEYGDYRINTFVNFEAFIALERLSVFYSITKRQVLELLITTADKSIYDKLDVGSEEYNKYYNINDDA